MIEVYWLIGKKIVEEQNGKQWTEHAKVTGILFYCSLKVGQNDSPWGFFILLLLFSSNLCVFSHSFQVHTLNV